MGKEYWKGVAGSLSRRGRTRSFDGGAASHLLSPQMLLHSSSVFPNCGLIGKGGGARDMGRMEFLFLSSSLLDGWAGVVDGARLDGVDTH